MMLCICCQVISCRLIFDIIKTFVERFSEADIEVLHLVMKGHTFYLDFFSFIFVFRILLLIMITWSFCLIALLDDRGTWV